LENVTNSLLVVSWAMPPLVYPRAIQVSRALKELSRRGWSIDVIALDALSSNSGRRDDAFASRYDGLYRLHPIEITSAIAGENRWWNRNQWLHRLLPADAEGRAWTKLASRRGRALVKAKKPRALVTFAQPWSDHLVGISLKRRFPSLPWIAHFSDPWVDSPYAQNEDPSVMDRWRTQEREVVRMADAVLFVNQRTAKLVMSKYPPEWGRKVSVVPHGFDADLLTPFLNSKAASDRLKFVHAGSMFEGLRDPFRLLEAIAILKRMIAPELMPAFEFVGSADARYAARAQDLGIDTITRFDEPTSYLKSLQIAAEADILIVIDTNLPGSVFFPSKVVDYLMFGKPILALTADDGETADILAPLGHVCVDASNPTLIAAAIAKLVKDREEITATVESRRSLADNYRISNTTGILETAIVRASERRQSIA
jgi:glycosyltransferase involved in cell wall biosynthesis